MDKQDNENEGNENEGMSTGKKVVAGAAIGVAVPAAVGVAKKILGNGDEEQGEEGARDENGSQQSGGTRKRSSSSGRSRSSQTSRARSSTTKRASGSSSKSRGSSSRGTASSGSRSRSSSSGQRSGTSSAGGRTRTKEQLYNQAKRLKIDGRSSMTKAQLERAISRKR
jgi:hypothetical protein